MISATFFFETSPFVSKKPILPVHIVGFLGILRRLFAGLDQNPDRLTAIVAVVEPDNGLRIGGEKSFKAFFVAGRPRPIDRNPRERKILGVIDDKAQIGEACGLCSEV